ncbi:DUF87 domain-containing protein [uncultured Bacteroides sp.]|uniref:ATP-binding protein n=1 Tax=uncultured Bacteroides sp. TaxID=162156 RepID=UPI0025F7733E|nr:DUF87 domain-containing protein [uncultured Bacteroides sp.]
MDCQLSSQTVDVISQISTSTAMAMSTSYCMQRRNFSLPNNESSLYNIWKRIDADSKLYNTYWMQIEQVGRPFNSDLKGCFTALQNILHACSIPKTQLLFLIIGENCNFKIYLGLKSDEDCNTNNSRNAIKEIDAFCNVSWPGLKSHVIDRRADDNIKRYIHKRFDHAYAFTGIPSMDLQKTDYPSTIEYLLGGCKPKGDIAYLVVADPVQEEELNNIVYMCDEMKGQAESFEKFNLTNSLQESISKTFTKTITETIGESSNDGESHRDIGSAVKTLIGIGIGIAAVAAFPPAAALIGSAASALSGAVGATAAAQLLGGGTMMGLGMLSSFIPQKSHNEGHNKSESIAKGESHGITESYSQSIGQTIVNGHIQAITEELKQHGERYREGKAKGMWRVGCYLFTDGENATSQIQLRSILSGSASRLEPIRVHDISSFVRDPNRRNGDADIIPFITPPELYVTNRETKEIFNHPFGRNFSELISYLTTDELTSMINLPLHTVPGVSVVEPAPQFRLDIPDCSKMETHTHIGNLMYNGAETNIPCQFELNNLTRHSLVCGVNGSGKTNTVLSVLNAMNQYNRNFMVIEPAKTEYVDWAISFNEQLKLDQANGERRDEQPIVIYMPGKDSYWHCDKNGKPREYALEDILKLNPFEPVCLDGHKPNVQAHMDRIKSIFALAFPMEDILPTVMESLIRDIYTNGERWLNRSKNAPLPELYPTLGLLSCRIKPVVLNLGYEPRVTGNIYAAVNLRIGNLLSGWKRELLNNEVLGGYKKLSKLEEKDGIKRPTWNNFFNRRVIINLSGVSDDSDRTFVMGLLLLYLYEYRIAVSETPQFNFNNNDLHHLMVVEEAHRVMMNNPNPDSPQYKCGQLFSNLLSEIRAYGQGIMIVDQVPSRLIPDAIKNTNMKIIHKLLSLDDVEMVADAMGVSMDQRKIIPKLSIGQAIVAGINAGKISNSSEEDIFWCKINKTK